MPRRIGTKLDVNLYARHNPFIVPQRGFAGRTANDDFARLDDFTRPLVHTAAAGLRNHYQDPAAAVSVMRLGNHYAVMSAPFIDWVQAAGLTADYYTLTGGTWETLTNGEHGDCRMYQTQGDAQITSVATKWSFPPNPIFAVSFWRAEMNRDWLPAGETASWRYVTQVVFGGTQQVCYSIPYGGDGPCCEAYNPWQSRWEAMPVMAGSGSVQAMKGLPGGEYKTLWFLVAADCVWVSDDCFAQNAVGYELPLGAYDAAGAYHENEYETHINSGAVELIHTAGQWWGAVHPVWMPNTGVGVTPSIQGPATKASYLLASNPETTGVSAWTDAVLADPVPPAARAFVQDAVGSVVTLSTTSAAWKLTWNSAKWTAPVAGFTSVETYSSPIIYKAMIDQAANVVAGDAAPAAVPVANGIVELELTWPGVGKPATGTMTLANEGGAFDALKDYQRISVSAGSLLDDATNDAAVVFTGFIITPGNKWRSGSRQELQVALIDSMARLSDIKAYGDEPDLGAFTGDIALRYLLARCGVPLARITGTGGADTLYDASGEGLFAETWVPAFGRKYEEIIAQVLKSDGDSVMYLAYAAAPTWETWTRTNGPFTATTVDYAIVESAAPEKSSAIHHLFDATRDRHGSDSSDYANLTVAEGRDSKGRPKRAWAIDASAYNPASDTFGGGWDHVETMRDEGLQSSVDIVNAADDLLEERKVQPEFVTVVTDMIPAARYGQVFSVAGPSGGKAARAGANAKKYRIEQYSHHIRKGALPQTTLTGRYIGAVV